MLKKQVWKNYWTVPLGNIPQDMVDQEAYKLSGFLCWTCGWRTEKLGYSGRQAVRAHSRIHALEKRAWRRPLAAVLAVLAFMGAAAASGAAGWLRSPAYLDVSVPAVALMSIEISALGLAVLVALKAGLPSTQPSPRLVWALRVAVAAALLPAVIVTVAEVSLLRIDLGWRDYILVSLAAALAAFLAPMAGDFRWLVRRRKRVPPGYTPLAEARDYDAQVELENRVRDQQTRVNKQPARQKQVPRPAKTDPNTS